MYIEYNEGSIVRHNVFSNPSATYELATYYGNSILANNISCDVSYNYWGVTTKEQIHTRIYDFFQNFYRPMAIFSPWIGSSSNFSILQYDDGLFLENSTSIY